MLRLVEPDSAELDLRAVQVMNRRAADAAARLVDVIESLSVVPDDDISRFARAMQGPDMLDVGCGPARYAAEFVKYGLAYTGIDLSPKQLAIARKRHPDVSFKLRSYRNVFGFADASFDGIWSCCVLNHEPKHNMKSVLRELQRVLRPGGLLYVVMPFPGESREYVGPAYPSGWQTYFADWLLDEFEWEAAHAGFERPGGFYRDNAGSFTCTAYKPR